MSERLETVSIDAPQSLANSQGIWLALCWALIFQEGPQSKLHRRSSSDSVCVISRASRERRRRRVTE